MMAVLRSLLLLFILYSVVNAENEKCPNGWTNFGIKCYKYFPQTVDWVTAEKNCQKHDASLASVHNKLENDLLLSMVPSNVHFWVGAQDGEQEGQWIWSDGSPFDYTIWCSGEPNNSGNKEHCMELSNGLGAKYGGRGFRRCECVHTYFQSCDVRMFTPRRNLF